MKRVLQNTLETSVESDFVSETQKACRGSIINNTTNSEEFGARWPGRAIIVPNHRLTNMDVTETPWLT